MADEKMDKPKSFISEFKEFAIRGNLIDIAVGVVIGAAFGKLTASFISDVLMPPIGKILGNVDFSKLQYVLQEGHKEVVAADGTVLLAAVPEVAIKYGAFINTFIDFIIIAFVMFMVIKGMNKMKRKQAEEPAPVPEPTQQEILLTEIRDLLKQERN